MWQKCFNHRQKGLAVIALDVRWLADTPPDEQRRMAQLLRGKLNIMSEACGAPVETRLCLTHMDGLEGFEDFARMLRQHGVPCTFDIPKHGEEERLGSLLEGQEQYLALGLTSLPVDAFERLERFYSAESRGMTGSGLGLSIVRSVAERHGGTVEALADTLRRRRVLAPACPARRTSGEVLARS